MYRHRRRFGLQHSGNSGVQHPVRTARRLRHDREMGREGLDSAEIESELDLEWSHAVAPGAGLVFFAAGDVITAMRDAVNSNACSVISVSFGLCGGTKALYTSTIHGIAQQAAAQGQTIVVAAGDTGAAGLAFDPARGCVVNNKASVNELASDPVITSIGGTSSMRVRSAARTARSVPIPLSGSGMTGTMDRFPAAPPAAASALTSRSLPIRTAWVRRKAAAINRRGPDSKPQIPRVVFLHTIQLSSHPGHYRRHQHLHPDVGGNIKLLEQKAGHRLGAINSRIYQIARQGQSGAGFYDITTGNNRFNGVAGSAPASATTSPPDGARSISPNSSPRTWKHPTPPRPSSS